MAIAFIAGGCYDVPKPDCGFRCSSSTSCPEGYTCSSDFRCHRNGSDPNLVCANPDAGPTADAYSPNATLTYPFVGTELNPNDGIQVTFDVNVENVNASTFTVVVTGTTTMVVGQVNYDPGLRRAVFFVDPYFPENTALTIRLDDAIVDPVSGRNLRPTTFDIMTSDDNVDPDVISIVPGNGVTGVGVGVNIAVGFSEPVMGVSSSSFTLTQGGAIAGTVTYNAQTRTAIFDPTDQLAPNAQHTVTLTSAIEDLSNNALSGAPVTSTFTTGPDTIAPSVRTTAPLANATAVAVGSNIVVTFDEPVMNVSASSFQVEGGTVAGTITPSNGNKTFTFDPDSDLPAATVIDVTLTTAITDTSSNALAAFAFSFTTN